MNKDLKISKDSLRLMIDILTKKERGYLLEYIYSYIYLGMEMPDDMTKPQKAIWNRIMEENGIA